MIAIAIALGTSDVLAVPRNPFGLACPVIVRRSVGAVVVGMTASWLDNSFESAIARKRFVLDVLDVRRCV